MDFGTSLKTVYSKYFDFTGRACRSEFWWFMLYSTGVSIVLDLLFGEIAGDLWSLAHLFPTLAVTCRRLHDTDRSGWWQVLPLIALPFVFLESSAVVMLWIAGGILVLTLVLLIVWYATRGTTGENRFGPDPFGYVDAEIFD